MDLPQLKIGDLTAKLPIIQGGMGVGISLNKLASAVANEGGIGIISGVQVGFRDPNFIKDPLGCNLRALESEIKLTKAKAPNGIIGVNFMVAMENYNELVKKAVECKVDLIISGAGLPLELPNLVKGSNTKIAPIVSSSKAAALICKVWDRKNRLAPDLIIVEGPLAGGHLGFTKAELQSKEASTLDNILLDVIKVVKPYEKKYNKNIAIIAAGGIHDGRDVKRLLQLGANGVQVGTRFITTHECDAHDSYKLAYLKAEENDINLVTSPVGMPGRAIINDLIRRDECNKHCLYKCLESCRPKEIPYCISQALFDAANGDINNGLLFCGVHGYKANKLQSVKEVMNELTNF
ncbi:MAG: nitronate monooxygenase [Epulopiscium sp.]|nr:nitronate monooxygenase [Candidatus Epulonipiscium sp.]